MSLDPRGTISRELPRLFLQSIVIVEENNGICAISARRSLPLGGDPRSRLFRPLIPKRTRACDIVYAPQRTMLPDCCENKRKYILGATDTRDDFT